MQTKRHQRHHHPVSSQTWSSPINLFFRHLRPHQQLRQHHLSAQQHSELQVELAFSAMLRFHHRQVFLALLLLETSLALLSQQLKQAALEHQDQFLVKTQLLERQVAQFLLNRLSQVLRPLRIFLALRNLQQRLRLEQPVFLVVLNLHSNRQLVLFSADKARLVVSRRQEVYLEEVLHRRLLLDLLAYSEEQHHSLMLSARHLDPPRQVSINNNLRHLVKLRLEDKQLLEALRQTSLVSKQQLGLQTVSLNNWAHNNPETYSEA